MSIINIILFFCVILLTNIIQAITGFAGTLLAMMPSIMLIGADSSKVILNLITLLTCAVIAFKEKKFINWTVIKKVVIFMGLGMLIGIKMYEVIKLENLLYFYGIIIILLALKKLFINAQINLSNILCIITLICAGIIHGMFISGGALLVVYISYMIKEKNEFRATMSCIWVILNSFMMITQIKNNIIGINLLVLTALALIPALLGAALGEKLHEKISKELFMKMTYVLLLFSGVSVFL